MENASKALYIAGATLIAVLILSLFVYLFSIGGRFAGNYESKKKQEKIDEFNAKLELYVGQNNTISDVVSVANLAYSVNKQNGFDDKNAVRIEVEMGYTTLRIEPNSGLHPNYFFKDNDFNSDIKKQVSFYDLMNETIGELRSRIEKPKISFPTAPDYPDNARLTDVNTNNYMDGKPREYRYHFIVIEEGISYNFGATDLVNKLVFELVPNPKYD